MNSSNEQHTEEELAMTAIKLEPIKKTSEPKAPSDGILERWNQMVLEKKQQLELKQQREEERKKRQKSQRLRELLEENRGHIIQDWLEGKNQDSLLEMSELMSVTPKPPPPPEPPTFRCRSLLSHPGFLRRQIGSIELIPVRASEAQRGGMLREESTFVSSMAATCGSSDETGNTPENCSENASQNASENASESSSVNSIGNTPGITLQNLQNYAQYSPEASQGNSQHFSRENSQEIAHGSSPVNFEDLPIEFPETQSIEDNFEDLLNMSFPNAQWNTVDDCFDLAFDETFDGTLNATNSEEASNSSIRATSNDSSSQASSMDA